VTLDLGIVTASLSPAAGGLFQSVRFPAHRLAQAGANVTVYGLWDDQFEAAKPAWDGLAVQVSPVLGPHTLGYSPDMRRRIVGSSHEILHQHGIWSFPSWSTDAWRRHSGRPTVISPRGMLDAWAVRNSSLKKRFVRLLYEDRNLAGASVIHALNESEAEAIRSFGLVNPIAVIPNGVDLPQPGEAPAKPAWVGSDDRRVLLFLGRIHPKKGLSELIAAWKRLADGHGAIFSGWRLVIGGWDDGGHLDALRAQVSALGLSRHISFAGPLFGDDKAAALAHASAFILPSYSEGLPVAVLEAWSWRLPVFMTRGCNLAHAFAAGSAIEIPTDPATMADTLAAYLDRDVELESIGEAGRALVERRFTWDLVVDEMQQLYGWLAGRGDRPACMLEQ